VLSNSPLNIRFRRVLRYDRWDFLLHLVEHLKSIHLSDEVDSFLWSLTAFRIFSVGSLYADFMIDHTIFLKKYLWKLKVPLKIRIFMCLLFKKFLLTKDNLAKHIRTGCKKMCFL
jgi:hypothetical protein